ncbi:type II toxin-antitoxin system PemK/MazF family toxin [Mediterraneibacter sp. NSJ-55]|uniref:Type II toxin-antitoxin system PemK/MazF family toxin n=1 Tax=Mediterraneibacter hominis TaxID=2763054 RepID=A0A923LG84_9FIRM|nr:type II toxin-antitoxin system PemK/MazF family toxin [Mediterraneibacter hominis]
MKQTLKQYDVVIVDFGKDVIDSEQGGKRPAVIIQNNIGNLYSPTTLVMPLSTKNKNPNQPTHTLIRKDNDNKLDRDSIVLGECLRQISKKRILKHIGYISDYSNQKNIKKVYDANFQIR